MNPQRRARFERLLAAARETTVDSLTAAQAALESIAGLRDQAGGDDEHDPEGVPLSAEWARLQALVTEATAQLREVDDARSRLENDAYGRCERCDGEIPSERLAIRPFARLCVPCGSVAR